MRSINTSRQGLSRVASALAVVAFTGVIGGAQATTWCVPGPPNPPHCDQSAPTIFLAKEAASAYDTIRVAAGTYPEGAIWITKPLTLLGAQAGVDARGRTVAPGTETIIMPAVAPNMPILVLGPGAAGTIIDGFTLLGGNLAIQNGLQPGESNDNLQVRNNRIVGFWAAGIALEAQGTDITIEQNFVDGSGVNHPDMLVSVRGNAPYPGLWLVNNTIVNGRMHADGFRVLQSSAIVEPSLTRAPLIKGNTLSGNLTGIFVGSIFKGGEITDNVITMNAQASLHGGFAGTLITRNLFLGNAGQGMYFYNGLAPGAITTNQVHGNAIIDNAIGAWYDGSEVINVAGNYWGAASGPYHSVRNQGGAGDRVVDQDSLGGGTGRLLFDPWLPTSPVPLPSATVWCVPEFTSGCDASSLTIRGAVSAAWPGDTVKVAAGTFDEGPIRIAMQLTLRGAQAGVDARNRSGAESIVTTPDIMAPIIILAPGSAGSTIDGFTLRGGDIGIQTDVPFTASVGGLQILNNRIDQFWAAGIILGYPGNDVTIEGNYVDGSNVNHPDMLVSVRASGPYHGLWLRSNSILNGGSRAEGFRVLHTDAHVGPSAARSPLISGNTFSGNNVGAMLGRFFESGEVSDNAFTGSVSHGLQGTLISTLVVGNAFEGNGGIGMSLASGSSGNTITDNAFVSNLGDGIRGGPFESRLSRNVFEGNRGFALSLFSAARDNTISANLLLGNGQFAGCDVAANPAGCGGGINLGTLSASPLANNITGNTISGNVVGAVYFGPNATQVRDLRGNDWGDASGPYHATRNPAGTGNAVIDQSSTVPPSGAGMILFDPWIGIGYTPAGTNVDIDVTASLPHGSTAWVGLGFDEVSAAGRTSVTTSDQGPTPPAGFQLGKPPVYYDVATTATFNGNVEVCFTWKEGQFHNEKMIRLQHYQANAWVDVTTSVDTAENVACGSVTSLSPFALTEVAYAFTGFYQPVANPPVLNVAKAGQSVSVKFSLGGYRGLDIFDPGYPKSGVTDCANPGVLAAPEPTVLAGTSVLQYEPTTDAYVYVWKTMPGWAKTCRVVVVNFMDGSQHTAYFQFKP